MGKHIYKPKTMWNICAFRLYFICQEYETIDSVIEMYVNYNPNPQKATVGDCVVRAVSKIMRQSWDKTYIDLCIEGLLLSDLPSANSVWGTYLRRHDFKRYIIPDTCPDCYTVADFAADHPKGEYILALNGHVVAVKDGDYFDTWDSGSETPVYFWQRKEQA